jgi:hypothetical protein
MVNQLGDYFHMTPYMDWFCEYEKYNGGDILLGDESISRIIGCGRVKLFHKDGRIRTLLWVFHIPNLARNLIYISNMSDVGVHTFLKGNLQMV